MTLITTERLLIRRLEVADLEDFQAYRTDPELARYQGWAVTSDAEAREFLLTHQAIELFQPDSWHQLGIAERNGRLIGDIGVYLSKAGDYCELGITLSQPAQQQGLAREALDSLIAWLWKVLEIEYVEAITDARNRASLQLLKRLGMQRTGVQTATEAGEAITEHVYRLARAKQP